MSEPSDAVDRMYGTDCVLVNLDSLLEWIETQFFNFISEGEDEERSTEMAMEAAKRIIKDVRKHSTLVSVDDFLIIKPGTTILTVKPKE